MIHALRLIYDRLHPEPLRKPLSTPDTQREATAAVVDAETFLYDAQVNKDYVNERVYQLKAEGHRNHFAELIESTMRGMG